MQRSDLEKRAVSGRLDEPKGEGLKVTDAMVEACARAMFAWTWEDCDWDVDIDYEERREWLASARVGLTAAIAVSPVTAGEPEADCPSLKSEVLEEKESSE